MVHLIPSRTNYTAPQVAELIFSEVYKHHGLPINIISDRDVLFTSNFWKHLHSLLGVKLRMSSAYHPETDGSTERANRTVTQIIRQCISPDQKDWVNKLPGIEFAINLARSDSTGYSPFFLNTGRIPRSMVWNSPSDSRYPGVAKFAQIVKHAVMSAHDSILAAHVKQTRDANRHRRAVPFTKGGLVYISTKNLSLKKGLARKLSPKFIGPYKILHDYGNNSYMIDLPAEMKQRGVHPVDHAQYL
jgi:transposase InsO family protein